MARLFETSKDVVELIEKKFDDTTLGGIGINLKVISTPKAKTIVKVQRASATTNFLTQKDVIITVFEEAFDRLSDEYKEKIVDGALSNISYDPEKDRLTVEGDIAKEMFRMRRKYDNYIDIMEAAYIIIEEIEEEEKRRKEEERLAKAEKKRK